jgi:O-methyltransferase/aklanonic acid methyltransferase
MIEHLRADAEASGLANVEARVGTADPAHLGRSFDVVCASLVLFFDPDVEGTLRDWVGLQRPGTGRIGLTTFGPVDEAWGLAEADVIGYGPDAVDARTTGNRGPFASTEGMAELLRACGADDVSSHDEALEVVLPDAAAWRSWTMTLGLRQFWEAVPASERETLLARVAERLEADRGADGLLHLTQQVRYTLGRARS